MKVTIELEDEYEIKTYMDAPKNESIVHETWEKVFRPNNKHKYGNKVLDQDSAHVIIEELAKIYLDMVESCST